MPLFRIFKINIPKLFILESIKYNIIVPYGKKKIVEDKEWTVGGYFGDRGRRGWAFTLGEYKNAIVFSPSLPFQKTLEPYCTWGKMKVQCNYCKLSCQEWTCGELTESQSREGAHQN